MAHHRFAIPGPAASLHQMPIDMAPGVMYGYIPDLTQQQHNAFRQHLNDLRLQAGPQLIAQLPPWFRPGPIDGDQHTPAWPGRRADYMIPIPASADWIPDIHTYQDGVNAFLRMLDVHYGGSVAARAQTTMRGGSIDCCRYGPRVLSRQLSTKNAPDRQAAFPWYMRPNTKNQRMYGLPDPDFQPRMLLSDYSMTITEVSPLIRLQQGTLINVASPEPLGKGAPAMTLWQRFLTALPAPTQALVQAGGAQADLVGGKGSVSSWHASGVYIRRMTYYPIRSSDAAAGLPSWSGYRFEGTYQCVYIYDSAFPNEDPHTAPISDAMRRGVPCRIGHHRMLSVVQRLLFHNADGLSRPGGRCSWIRDPGTVWIGGGGNIGGVDECQRMTAIWMCQVAYLSRALDLAIFHLYHNPSSQTEQDFLRARREWRAFFVGYIECCL